jgi:hypothetical protein
MNYGTVTALLGDGADNLMTLLMALSSIIAVVAVYRSMLQRMPMLRRLKSLAARREQLKTEMESGKVKRRSRITQHSTTSLQVQDIMAKLRMLRGVVTTMIQTEKYGTPIAAALRVLTAEFRNERMMRAEAKAARLPALMTVPMIIFTLPPLFIVIMGPGACTMMDALGKAG